MQVYNYLKCREIASLPTSTSTSARHINFDKKTSATGANKSDTRPSDAPFLFYDPLYSNYHLNYYTTFGGAIRFNNRPENGAILAIGTIPDLNSLDLVRVEPAMQYEDIIMLDYNNNNNNNDFYKIIGDSATTTRKTRNKPSLLAENRSYHAHWINNILWSNDDARIFTTSDDFTAYVYDVERQKRCAHMNTKEYGSGHGMCQTESNSSAIYVCAGNVCICWDTRASTSNAAAIVFAGHTSTVTDCILTDGDLALITTSMDGTLKLWDVRKREKPLHTAFLEGEGEIYGGLMSVELDPTCTDLLVNTEGDAFSMPLQSLLTAASTLRSNLRNYPTIKSYKGCMNAEYFKNASFSPDGRAVIAGSDTGEAIIWNSATTRQISRLKFPRFITGDDDSQMFVKNAYFGPKGSDLVAVSSEISILLFSTSKRAAQEPMKPKQQQQQQRSTGDRDDAGELVGTTATISTSRILNDNRREETTPTPTTEEAAVEVEEDNDDNNAAKMMRNFGIREFESADRDLLQRAAGFAEWLDEAAANDAAAQDWEIDEENDLNFGCCSYANGYREQNVYLCLTCLAAANRVADEDNRDKRAGVCSQCAEFCHRFQEHEVINIGKKKHFRCDCGNAYKFPNGPRCSLMPEKESQNPGNAYNHNFENRWCYCDRTEQGWMVQCVECMDWFHADTCVGGMDIDNQEQEDCDYVCEGCVRDKYPFLDLYPGKTRTDDVVTPQQQQQQQPESTSNNNSNNNNASSSENGIGMAVRRSTSVIGFVVGRGRLLPTDWKDKLCEEDRQYIATHQPPQPSTTTTTAAATTSTTNILNPRRRNQQLQQQQQQPELDAARSDNNNNNNNNMAFPASSSAAATTTTTEEYLRRAIAQGNVADAYRIVLQRVMQTLNTAARHSRHSTITAHDITQAAEIAFQQLAAAHREAAGTTTATTSTTATTPTTTTATTSTRATSTGRGGRRRGTFTTASSASTIATEDEEGEVEVEEEEAEQ